LLDAVVVILQGIMHVNHWTVALPLQTLQDAATGTAPDQHQQHYIFCVHALKWFPFSALQAAIAA
jgi:hypothetical protein